MKMETVQLVQEYLEGAYDLHTHSAPSNEPRNVTDFDLLREADSAKMAGVMLKYHQGATQARAMMANLAVAPQYAQAFGSITLNNPVGGLNPDAVEAAAQLGAKMVWMPTCDARNNLVKSQGLQALKGRRSQGLSVLDDRGALVEEVYQIFDVAQQYSMAVGTGHLSLEESMLLCRAGRERKLRMVLTHPEWVTTRTPVEVQVELSQQGVLIEKSWVSVPLGDITADELVKSIFTIGADRVFMTTDHGAAFLKRPLQAMIDFIVAMLDRGVDGAQLRQMLHTVPEQVLGLTE